MEAINENRIGYKQTQLGWIPNEWGIELLDHLANRGSGHTPSKSFDQYYNGDIKWISLADSFRLDRGYIDATEIEISLEGIKKSSAVLHKAGTVVLSRDAGVGKSAVMKSDMAVSQHFITWTCGELLDNWFLYYWLQYNKEYFERQAVGSTIKTIGLGLFKKLKIVVPPSHEQKKIAKILLTMDGLINRTENVVSLVRKRNKGLLQRLLIPDQSWKEYKMGELITEVRRPVKWDDKEVYDLVSVRRRSGGAFFREALKGEEILTKNLFTVMEGDFLISKMQIVHGASSVVPNELSQMKVSGSYVVVRSKDIDILDIDFFNLISKTQWFYRRTFISSYGVHIEKMTFDFEDFKRHKIKLPKSIKKQKYIVSVFQTANSEEKLYERSLLDLKKQRAGLLQKLLTGEIRVKP